MLLSMKMLNTNMTTIYFRNVCCTCLRFSTVINLYEQSGNIFIELSFASFQLATEVEPSQPLAWQGLGALQEKHPKMFDTEESLSILSELCKTAE